MEFIAGIIVGFVATIVLELTMVWLLAFRK